MHRALGAHRRPRGQHRSDGSLIACVWHTTGCRAPAVVRLATCQATDDAKALSQVVASGPPGILGFGFGEQELANIQRHFEPVELRVVSGAAACCKGATLADAVRLLSTEAERAGESSEAGEKFICFSRVIIFSGLPGEVIEGLIEVWPAHLCESELISFAYFAESMAGGELEESLLKIIQASDAHDMEGVGEDGAEEASEGQLRDLREMLNEMKNSKHGKLGKHSKSRMSGMSGMRQVNGDMRSKGFGR